MTAFRLDQPTGSRWSLSSNLLLFVVAVALEAIYYPAIATTVYGWIGGEGGPGSSMGYFRDHYVVPAAIALVFLTGIGLIFATIRAPKIFRVVLIAAWLLNLTSLLISSLWYFQAIKAAGSRTG